MIRGIPVTSDRKPTLAFQRDWQIAMMAKKTADPTLQIYPLPGVEIVDKQGVPTPQFVQLARLFTPALARQPFVDRDGNPTDYALTWWKEAT